jgi:hypothetical protein
LLRFSKIVFKNVFTGEYEMKCKRNITRLAYGIGLALMAGQAVAHESGSNVGAPACLEANFMMADAMNNDSSGFGPAGNPWAAANGAGQVLEVNIVTGARGITVANPFHPDNIGSAVCPNGAIGPVTCELPPPAMDPFGDNQAPFKPTGVLSGGLNGHAFITSAAQQSLTEFHRDGTPIRTVSFKPVTGNPNGPPGFGTLPRPLGTQMMPNGNIVQAICDANFFNAKNSDRDPGWTDPQQIKDGNAGAGNGNLSWQFFPPVYSTPARAANSRVLVLDQESLAVIDEYSQPADQDARWTCMAGLAFSEEGMGVSMFHGAAIAMVDWKAGLEDHSAGVGSNNAKKNKTFEIGEDENRSEVTRWIDMRPGKPADDPSRRDSLRAWGYDEDGTIYVTDRERSKDCVQGEIPPPWSNLTGLPVTSPCHPGVFRQKIQVVDWGNSEPDRTIGLDPGVNVIAGMRPNRMSAIACDNIGGPNANGQGTSCDVETLLVAASAFNPGCAVTVGGPNKCMVPGGGVGEYSIDPNDADGGSNNPAGGCNGIPSDDAGNAGCAQPIAQFLGANPSIGTGSDTVDPRMLMVIHEPFIQ